MSVQEKISTLVEPLLATLGYELVHVEFQSGRGSILRIFIASTQGITVEDCAKASRAIEEPLRGIGEFELEVSSPGIFRPLHKKSDYEKFAGKRARIHTFRPLAGTECDNPGYLSKNRKQKNFIGTLKGLSGTAILMDVSGKHSIKIPFELVAKANLEPELTGANIKE
ncbi:MAG: hypothetical protein A2583_15475 [Bdellovibrionales bacterium RIFOXYD1_FULL_53_11]|nr:MAG: hypothetical protein A2583_15475 [Bdellovibrionales bacterium RIFOXYD1_FULL_53_11]